MLQILTDPKLTQAGAALLGALIGVSGTLLVTIINSFAGRGKFMRERLWERRQEACNTIVGELKASAPFAERIRDGFADDPHAFWGSSELDRANSLYADRVIAAHNAFERNYLILPAPFRKRYERMVRDRMAWDYYADPDAYLGPIDATSSGAQDLMDLALATLGIVPFWERFLRRWRPTMKALSGSVARTNRKLRRKWRRWRSPSDDFDG